MITEDYVSFETAKLLKEKGFDCEKSSITAMYNELGEFKELSTAAGQWCYDYEDFDEYDYVAPTHHLAMKWLREEKKLYVNVWADPKDFENDDFSTTYRMHVYNGTSNNGTREFSKYEDACEAGIRYCLENLI